MTSSSAADVHERVWMSSLDKEHGIDVTASEEELLAGSHFLGTDDEVFKTPPEQSSQGQWGKDADVITISSSSEEEEPVRRRKEPSKPRICVRKVPVRGIKIRRTPSLGSKVRGIRIRTPSPSHSPSTSPRPDHPVETTVPQPVVPEASQTNADASVTPPQPIPSPFDDPLVQAVLMIPCDPAPTFTGDILELARKKGIF